jgi:hypothetical protein
MNLVISRGFLYCCLFIYLFLLYCCFVKIVTHFYSQGTFESSEASLLASSLNEFLIIFYNVNRCTKNERNDVFVQIVSQSGLIVSSWIWTCSGVDKA